MGKYDPLRDYLKRQRSDEFEMSFTEIERKLGAMLPNRAAAPDWWAGGGGGAPSVQHEAWLAAGFSASHVVGQDRVRFRRLLPATDGSAQVVQEPEGSPLAAGRVCRG